MTMKKKKKKKMMMMMMVMVMVMVMMTDVNEICIYSLIHVFSAQVFAPGLPPE